MTPRRHAPRSARHWRRCSRAWLESNRDEDRDPSRLRTRSRALLVRQRVLHALDEARPSRRDLLGLSSLLHRQAKARRHGRQGRALQAPRRQARQVEPLMERAIDGDNGAPMPADQPRMPDGMPVAGRDAPLGGQAVLEGVMMRGVSTWAVAVRKPLPEDAPPGALGEIEVTSEPLVSWAKRHRVLRLPVIRGVVALGESLKIGFKALGISANAQLEEEEDQEPIGGVTWALTIAFSMVLAIGLFFVIPVGATSLIKDEL